MPIYHVTFTKEFDMVIKAASAEALQAALDDMTDHDVTDLAGGDEGRWEGRVLTKPVAPTFTTKTGEVRDVGIDGALVDGEIANYDWDYLGDVAAGKTAPIDPEDPALAAAEMERRERHRLARLRREETGNEG